MTYVCPDHGFRHILPLDSLDPHVRAQAESPSARQRLAGQSRRFTRGLLVAALALVAVAALAIARHGR